MSMTTSVVLADDATQTRAAAAGFLAQLLRRHPQELRHRPAHLRRLVRGGEPRALRGPPALKPACPCGTFRRRRATPILGPMRYDRGRGPLDRHATYIVATFLAGASR